MSPDSKDTSKRGVTHAIRRRLNFLDERLWKRFSARRLELIDTLDLSSKKASEQDDEVKRVAETLRIEFEYGIENYGDFEKLVRAAVQSVRRNRKRSSKSNKMNDFKDSREEESPHGSKRIKLAGPSRYSSTMDLTPSVSPTASFHHELSSNSSNDNIHQHRSFDSNGKDTSASLKQGFLSEISNIRSDTLEEVYDMNYPKSKMFTPYDHSKSTINSMIEPRITSSEKQVAALPPISNLNVNSIKANISSARATLLNYIERSKSCSESATQRSASLEYLGKSIISTSIAYLFAVTFSDVNEKSLEYLRDKTNNDSCLADMFRKLHQKNTQELTDKVALISFKTLVGGCTKDFGVEKIVSVLCDLFYYSVIEEYPLAFRNSTPSHRQKLSSSCSNKSQSNSLSSLATVAADLSVNKELSQSTSASSNIAYENVQGEPSPQFSKSSEKSVRIRFLSSVLTFRYSMDSSATPRLAELIENARSAFKLASLNDSILGVKTTKEKLVIKSDAELEKIFKTQDDIDLEIFTQRPQAIPIYEITSTVVPSKYTNDSPKIILPPPVNHRSPLNHPGPLDPIHSGVPGFKLLSNSEEIAPMTMLPKFQPLL